MKNKIDVKTNNKKVKRLSRKELSKVTGGGFLNAYGKTMVRVRACAWNI